MTLVRAWAATVLPTLLGGAVSWELIELIERHLDAGITYVREHCKAALPSTTNNQLTQSLLDLLTVMLSPATASKASGTSTTDAGSNVSSSKSFSLADNWFDASTPNLSSLLRLVFVWCFVWAIGGNLRDDDSTHDSSSSSNCKRALFEEWAKDRFRPIVGSGSPFLRDMFSVVLDLRLGEFSPWSANLPLQTPPTSGSNGSGIVLSPRLRCDSIFIPTTESVRHTFMMSRLTKLGRNVLLAGESGCGKSSIIRYDALIFTAYRKATALLIVYMGCFVH
jgi:Dynein heavy chain AAA lid domain/P-loop containing dynein motor region